MIVGAEGHQHEKERTHNALWASWSTDGENEKLSAPFVRIQVLATSSSFDSSQGRLEIVAGGTGSESLPRRRPASGSEC